MGEYEVPGGGDGAVFLPSRYVVIIEGGQRGAFAACISSRWLPRWRDTHPYTAFLRVAIQRKVYTTIKKERELPVSSGSLLYNVSLCEATKNIIPLSIILASRKSSEAGHGGSRPPHLCLLRSTCPYVVLRMMSSKWSDSAKRKYAKVSSTLRFTMTPAFFLRALVRDAEQPSQILTRTEANCLIQLLQSRPDSGSRATNDVSTHESGSTTKATTPQFLSIILL